MKSRFDEHIGAIYSAVGNPQGWSEILQTLVTDMKIRSGMITLDNQQDQSILISSSAGISNRDIELMTGDFLGQDVWTNELHKLESGQFYVSEEMFDDSALLKTDFYNELCREVDLRYSTGCVIDSQGQYDLRIALQATHDQETFGTVIDYLNRLVPHLRQASRLHQLLGNHVNTKNSIEVLIEALTEPAAILNSNLTIKYANTMFEANVLKHPLHQNAHHAHSWLSNDDAEALKHLISNLQNGRLVHNSKNQKTALCQLNSKVIEIEMIDTGPSEASFKFIEPVILIRVKKSSELKDLSDDIALLFNLTRREKELAELLCAGETLASIADFRNRSIHTLKSQLTAIFKKTETTSQTQLVAKLLGKQL